MADPRVYIILNLDTNLEVETSTFHLFNEEGEIIRTRHSYGTHFRMPLEELDRALSWGAEELARHYEGAYRDYVG